MLSHEHRNSPLSGQSPTFPHFEPHFVQFNTISEIPSSFLKLLLKISKNAHLSLETLYYSLSPKFNILLTLTPFVFNKSLLSLFYKSSEEAKK